MSLFKKVMLVGEGHFCHRPGHRWSDVFGTHCREARRIGITHIQVNYLADPFHQIQLEQPDNYYAWFATYGPSLDQFVSSDLNRGLYLEAQLNRNRQKLLESAELAVQAGLKPMLLLCEPRFVPERFFQKYPYLRGPRVDNPAFSTTPWYALCTDIPTVREHYRQMLMQLMILVPDMSGINIFTHDSGSGFCHSTSLYAGPNGPRTCRGKKVGQRIAEFLNHLQDVGRTVNSDFFVSLSTSVENQERIDFLEFAKDGVSADVRGRYSWLGGLEDQWAAHQYGSQIEQVGYERARKERIEEISDQIAFVHKTGKSVSVICSMPTDGFLAPLRYVPHPVQNLEILKLLEQKGADHLNMKGDVTAKEFVRYDINRESVAAYFSDSERPIEQIMKQLAEEWVGKACTEILLESFELTETAYRHRPLWCWSFAREASFLPGPLVPAPDLLTQDDHRYYWHQGLADFDSIPGFHRLGAIKINETERTWMLNTYRTEILPFLERAMTLLQKGLQACESGEGKRCFQEQIDHLRHFYLWQQSAYNWCEAGCFLAPGEGNPEPQRSIHSIVMDEIDVTERMICLLEGRENFFLDIGPVEGLLYDKWPNFLRQLSSRIEVMRNHQNDKIKTIEEILQ